MQSLSQGNYFCLVKQPQNTSFPWSVILRYLMQGTTQTWSYIIFLSLQLHFFFPTIFNFRSSPNPRPGSAVKQAVSRRSTHSAVPPSSFQMLPLKVMNCQVVRKASYLNYREGRQRKQHTMARGPFSSSFLHTPVEQNCEFPGKSLM